MLEGAFLYILRCADGSYYVGITRTTLEIRIAHSTTLVRLEVTRQTVDR
jgi:putative endonuclease